MTGGPLPRFRRRRALAAAAVTIATAALFWVSKGRWSDPLIDSGREWIVPDALSRGELLYRDVVYWFGPFTPYFQALFFKTLGSGFAALVASGVVTAAGTLAALFAVLRRVTSRKDAALWTILAIPALIFMPNAGGALLGMGYRIWQAAAFALAGVALASQGKAERSKTAGFAAGALAGLSGLCRTEWGVLAIAAVVLACVVKHRSRAGLREAFVAGVGYAAVFAIGLGLFIATAGENAVVRDGHVLLTGLPQETRHFLLAFSGVADWGHGIAELLYSTAMWLGVFLLAALLARPQERGRTRVLRGLGAVLVVLAVTALAGGAGGAVLFSAAPAVSLAGALCGLWRRRGGQAAALTACGFLGILLSYRRPFHIGDSAYVGPPLLFAFVCAAGLLRLGLARERRRSARVRLDHAWRWAVSGLVAIAFAARAWQYQSLEAAPIAGTSGMLTARPSLAREIEDLAAAIRSSTHDGDGLVVFPEGELLNLLSGRPNPIRHKLYLPGYLTEQNEPAVLAELEASQPAAVVLWLRPTSEYERGFFGQDYGRAIRSWLEAGYSLQPFHVAGTPLRLSPRFVLALRRTPR